MSMCARPTIMNASPMPCRSTCVLSSPVHGNRVDASPREVLESGHTKRDVIGLALAVRCRPANAFSLFSASRMLEIKQLEKKKKKILSCRDFALRLLPFTWCLAANRRPDRGTASGLHGTSKERRFRALLHPTRPWRRLRATHWLARVARVVLLRGTAASYCACRSLHQQGSSKCCNRNHVYTCGCLPLLWRCERQTDTTFFLL
ncbi:hypothetical protein IWX49DRAFT_240301 [Phyllosticta citricarpa]|uniref:Uncharacterized protein n=1 Tax=Phyllosticta citricarpa TaxID=55181 RepID=A0ABR1MH94_9PEZI